MNMNVTLNFLNNSNFSFEAKSKYPSIPYPELAQLVHNGCTYREIGERYNVPLYVVARLIKSYKIPTLSSENKILRQQEEKLFAKQNRIQNPDIKSEDILDFIVKKLNLNKEDLKKSVKFDI